MKILHALPEGMGRIMSEDEVTKFLENKTNLHLATVDEKGEPNIQPVWFYHDREHEKIYLHTSKESKKVRNIRRKPNVYFAVDEDNFPYRCVKGKSTITISENLTINLPIVEKICIKYLGSLDHEFSKMLLDEARRGTSVVLELTPRFYSTWDFTN